MINALIININTCIRKENNSNYQREDCRNCIINRINNSNKKFNKKELE